MLDKLGVYELDNISDENLIKIAGIYKKTVGSKYDFEQPIDYVAWLQGLYNGEHILIQMIASMMSLVKED